MESKKIDNKIKSNKQRINEIDNILSIEKQKIKKIDEMQETIYELNKNMNKCIDLLSKSIKGKTTDIIFNDIENANRKFYIKTNNVLEEETIDTMKKINKLYKEKNQEVEKNRAKKEKE